MRLRRFDGFIVASTFAALAVVATGDVASAQDDGIRRSVARIHVARREPNFLQPWIKGNPQNGTGSGFVIEGNRVMTNAHVIIHASQISVQGYGSDELISATVESIGLGIDLAVLKLEDESFFSERPPLPWVDRLPRPGASVKAYGYPLGGDQLAVTEGIVSRIEYAGYNYRTAGLRIQIDAALNPGNSGGPVVSDGTVVGVGFSGIRGADNIAYAIPIDEIRLFSADVADGKYDGKPRMYDELQTVENPALRARLGLERGVGGIMVKRPGRETDEYPLKEWDVITHIGGHAIDAQGLVQTDDGLNLSMFYLLPQLAVDGHVPLSIVRNREKLDVSLPVDLPDRSVLPILGEAPPRYFIHGPLVFSTLTQELLARGGAPVVARAPEAAARIVDQQAFDGEELVVVPTTPFPHRLMKGYNAQTVGVISQVNDVPVKNLTHLVELIRDAQGEFIEFKFAGRGIETLVFRREELAASTEDILSDNEVRKQSSPDLEAVWNPAG